MTSDHNRQPWYRISGRVLTGALLLIACLCLGPAGPYAADSPDRPKRILVIPSYNFDYKGIQWFLQGVIAEFTEHKPFKVTFLLENLQLATHPSDRKHMDNMAASLKIKYSLEKPDLIIVQYKQALQFMERYGKEIFGDVPVVFAGLSVEGYIPDRLSDHYTGIVASFSGLKNIELILQNHPKVKKIYVVGGSSPVERDLVQETIKEGVAIREKVELIALTDMTFPALLTKLGMLENDSAVMYQALQLDAAGQVFVPAQAAIEIAKAASVQVYGMLDTYRGSGITGGFLINHEGLGRRAAKIAIQWLQSGTMQDTQVITEPIGSYWFDGRQLQRWGVEENKIPPGSQIEFKAFSVWGSYKKEIVGGIFLILLQTVLIIGLLQNRYKRMRAESKLQRSEEQFRTILQTAMDGFWLVDLQGRLLEVNDAYSRMSGYSEPELLALNTNDLEAAETEDDITTHIQKVIGQGEDRFESRHRRKDGSIFDVEVSVQYRPTDGGRLVAFLRDITSRKQVEEALRESEERFRTITANTPDHILMQDRQLRYTFVVNPQLGLTEQEMIGRTDYDFLSKEEADQLTLIKTRLLESGQSIHFETSLISKAGESEFFDGTFLPKFNAHGQVDGLIGYFKNVTYHKRMEEALRKTEERYRTLFSHAGDGIFLLSGDGTLIEVNDSFARMHGYSMDEMLQMNLKNLDTPETFQLAPERLRRLWAGESLTFEVEHYHKDGHVFPLEVSASLISYGGESYVQCFHRDITDRKQAEKALRESEERYKQLVEYAPAAIYEADLTTGRLLSVNEVLCEYSGYTRDELLALNPLDLMTEESQKLILQRMASYAAGEPVPTTVEYKARSKTGREFWISTNAKYFYRAGLSVRATVVAHDISERKRAEEEKRSLEERLQRSEKMEALGQMAGGVAHDLNNVLGILSGYSELLLEEIPEGHRSRGYAEQILQSTEKGAAIIQDLLTLARRGVAASDVINLNSVVSGFLKTPVFEKMKDYNPHVTFRIECDKNLLNIKGSPVHLEKTLMNLVSNAAESISGKGEVTIRTESRYLDRAIRGYDEVKEGDYAVLTVSDTGMGIPAENREKIFEPFYTKKTMGRSGTGLGLAIVWGTVKDHKGYIDVQTEVGQGTTFTLYFPVTREELMAPQQKAPMERYMGKGESVLVVDDIAEQRDVAARLLTRLGYEVHAVSSGEEAIEYLKGNKADILVLDMIMAPGIDGLETYQRVLEISPKQKAILVSGFSETERVREAQKLGAGVYVRKPYVLEKIGMAIRDELK